MTLNYLIDISWTQNWWWYLIASMLLVYLGLMGLFADLGKLSELKFIEKTDSEEAGKSEIDQNELARLKTLMAEEKLYLHPI